MGGKGREGGGEKRGRIGGWGGGGGQKVSTHVATEGIQPVLLASCTRACNFGLRVITHFLV